MRPSDAPPASAGIDLLAIGEALADLFPGGPVVGGAPFNVARHAAALGLRTAIVTRIGDDPIGESILAECRRFGLADAGVQRDAARRSGTVQVVLAHGAHRFEIGADAAWDAIDADEAEAAARRAAPAFVCFGTLAQRTSASRAAVHAALAGTSAIRVLDLNLRDDLGPAAALEAIATRSLRLAEIVKTNDDELARLLGWLHSGPLPAWGSEAHTAAVHALQREFGWRLLVVTRGAAGASAFDPQAGLWLHSPAPPVAVVDSVGAGDAFTAVLILGMRRGWPLPVTIERAAAYAASVCTLRGAVSPEPAFYAAWRTAWGS